MNTNNPSKSTNLAGHHNVIGLPAITCGSGEFLDVSILGFAERKKRG
jgi:hypothetical protein